MKIFYKLTDTSSKRIHPPDDLEEMESIEDYILETIKWKQDVSRQYFIEIKNIEPNDVGQAIENLQEKGAPIAIKIRE